MGHRQGGEEGRRPLPLPGCRNSSKEEALGILCAQSCCWGTENGHRVALGESQRCLDKHPKDIMSQARLKGKIQEQERVPCHP